MRHTVFGIFLTAASFIVTGCLSTPQTKKITLATLHPYTKVTEHKHTAFYSQQRYRCGPAALATAMDAAGKPRALATITSSVYLPGRKGSLPTDLIGATRRNGLIAYRLRPSLNDLLTEISDGNVVIVFQNLGIKWIPRWHFAVVVGYNLNNRTIILRSGKHKRRVTPLKLFERTWKRSGYWSILVTPISRIPKTASAFNWLFSLSLFDQHNKKSPKTNQAYLKALSRWPEYSLLNIAYGNYLYRRKHLKKAYLYYKKASTLDPDNGDAWNNMANLMIDKKNLKLAKSYSLNAIRSGGRNSDSYKRTLGQITLLLKAHSQQR